MLITFQSNNQLIWELFDGVGEGGKIIKHNALITEHRSIGGAVLGHVELQLP